MESTNKVIYTSDSRRIIDCLLDLIALEGIYPCLLPGVGVPVERRVKSILNGGMVSMASDLASDHDSLGKMQQRIVKCLHSILLGGNHGISIAVRERILVDLIAAEAQLSFAPECRTPQASSRMLNELIARFGSFLFLTWLYRIQILVERFLVKRFFTDMSQDTYQHSF